MSTSTVKVAVRVRPMAAKELLANSTECVSYISGTNQIVIGGSNNSNSSSSTNVMTVGPDSAYWMAQKSFTFDYVFDPLTTQDLLYADCVAPLVDRFLEGFNATVLAYGQTGSGKTYSMGIGLDTVAAASPVSYQGIVPRAIASVFQKIQRLTQNGTSSSKAQLFVSFLELHNEELVDLLNPRPRSAVAANMAPTIREDGTGRIMWLNTKEEVVNSPDELLSLLQRGTMCRTTASTDMNASSSRSHAIFTMTLRQEKSSGSMPQGSQSLTDTADDMTDASEMQTRALSSSNTPLSQVIVSKFHFVDLAGSERLKRTNAEGERKKEGISINQGLLALGNVISALGDETRRSSHVPYRDSKLTRMLQDSLGGNSQTLMLACISPSDLNYAETVNTLHYANRARNIKNRVSINQEWQGSGVGGGALEKDREIKQLRQTVSQLRTELAMIRATGGMGPSDAGMTLSSGSMQLDRADIKSDGIPVQSTLDPKEARYYQRRERDLMAELDVYKSTQRTIRFNMDRLQFRCNRLHSRVLDLVHELAQTSIERDAAVLEKCRLLVPGTKLSVNGENMIFDQNISNANAEDLNVDTDDIKHEPVKNQVDLEKCVNINDESLEEIDAATNNTLHNAPLSSQLGDVHPIVQEYISTIFALRIKLTVVEDRLAWHTETMSKLGRKGARFAEPAMAWTEAEDKKINISTTPSLQSLKELKTSPHSTEIMHERSLVKGLRNDPLVQRMFHLDESQAGATGVDASVLKHIDTASSLRPSALINDSLSMSGTDMLEANGTDDRSTADPDMFLIINKIQNDISDHEALVERIHRRDAEYDVMKKAYEQKLNVLSSQLSQFQKERDQALKRMQSATGGSKKDRAGKIAAATSKYDDEKRRLDGQIEEYKRKLGDNSRLQSNSRSRADQLTKELHTTIEALKAEKARMLQDLRKEAQKHRDQSTANQREIARLRRKERAAAEATKRLERSNQLQRLVLKKHNEEMSKSQSKLKNVMRLLKRSSTPNRIFKSLAGMGSGSSSPTGKRSAGNTLRPSTVVGGRSGNSAGESLRRALSNTTASKLFTGRDSPMRLNAASAATSNPSAIIRAEFKKQMVDKELSACVLSRRTHAALNDLKARRQKLVGEQHELIAERGRVVQAEYKRTGCYDADTPQYMDKRLQAIDVEIGSIDIKMNSLEGLIEKNTTVISYQNTALSPTAHGDQQDLDLSWENALNLIRSLDHMELEAAVGLFLEDIIEYRVVAEESQIRIQERENVIAELKRMTEVLRATALAQSETIQERRREVEAVVNSVSVTDVIMDEETEHTQHSFSEMNPTQGTYDQDVRRHDFADPCFSEISTEPLQCIKSSNQSCDRVYETSVNDNNEGDYWATLQSTKVKPCPPMRDENIKVCKSGSRRSLKTTSSIEDLPKLPNALLDSLPRNQAEVARLIIGSDLTSTTESTLLNHIQGLVGQSLSKALPLSNARASFSPTRGSPNSGKQSLKISDPDVSTAVALGSAGRRKSVRELSPIRGRNQTLGMASTLSTATTNAANFDSGSALAKPNVNPIEAPYSVMTRSRAAKSTHSQQHGGSTRRQSVEQTVQTGEGSVTNTQSSTNVAGSLKHRLSMSPVRPLPVWRNTDASASGDIAIKDLTNLSGTFINHGRWHAGSTAISPPLMAGLLSGPIAHALLAGCGGSSGNSVALSSTASTLTQPSPSDGALALGSEPSMASVAGTTVSSNTATHGVGQTNTTTHSNTTPSISACSTGAMGGIDVFERLANAHTLASQAKVIQRVVVDKDALMQEIANGKVSGTGTIDSMPL
ncbi:hypothetical protein BDV3_000688 [Batrachochytrium dendrobatidis]